MIASLLLLAFVFGSAGRWEVPLLLSWLTAGVLTLSAAGERVAVRVVCRFRRLPTVEHAATGLESRLARSPQME
jgi:hypothetical protein